MSILDKLEVRDTHNRRPMTMNKPLILDMEVENTGPCDTLESSYANEYILRVVVGVSFAANHAQYEHAFQNARKIFLHKLYEDIFGLMLDLRRAILAGDGSEALSIVDRIDKEIGK